MSPFPGGPPGLESETGMPLACMAATHWTVPSQSCWETSVSSPATWMPRSPTKGSRCRGGPTLAKAPATNSGQRAPPAFPATTAE
eukprot:6374761-Pyramimonas_sp.AAC.1